MAPRPVPVGHNLDFPETDSDPVCTIDVFLTTYILACALLVTFQPLPALLVILSRQSCVICGLSVCVTTQQQAAKTGAQSSVRLLSQTLFPGISGEDLCRPPSRTDPGSSFFWSLKSRSLNVSALACSFAFENVCVGNHCIQWPMIVEECGAVTAREKQRQLHLSSVLDVSSASCLRSAELMRKLAEAQRGNTRPPQFY